MNQLKTKISIAIIGTFLFPTFCLAQSTFNLGTLDLKIANNRDQLQLVGEAETKFSENITITNYSDQSLDLRIYTADAKLNGQNFLPADEAEVSYDAANWISLPTDQIKLAARESHTIDISVNFPTNAGVGKHLAAIMFKYQNKDEQGNIINIEKGIRVIADVTGTPISKYKIINPQISSTNRFLTYTATLLNSGNTDLKGTVSLTNQNSNQVSDIFLKPDEESLLNFAVEKPAFGQSTLLSTIELNNSAKTFVLSEDFYWPDFLGLLLFILTLIVAGGLYLAVKNKELTKKQWAKSSLKKIILFMALSGVGIYTISNFPSISSALLKTDTFINTPDTGYLTTIKWGDFTKINTDNINTTLWNGTIKASSGRMIIVEKLNVEHNDKIYLNTIGNILTFKNTTGPDNDGVIIIFKADPSDTNPSLTYKNNLSGDEFNIPITSTLKRPTYVNYKSAKVEFKTTISGENVNLKTAEGETQINTLTLQATPSGEVPIYEIQSTPNNEIIIDGQASEDNTIDQNLNPSAPQTVEPNTRQFEEELSLLRSIIKDLPSSPEILSQYILNSDFVQQVSSANNSATITAAPALISKLKDTPLTIQEISASADQNFIFVPNQKIKLTPQQFSFDQSKISSQVLGEIIFVQNKDISWNTYLSISNFVAVSGKGTIPASNVTIIPGSITMINQTGENPLITAGNRHRMSGSNDQATLVSVTPSGQGEAIFSMHPEIFLEVPPSTLPGLYRAEISIKEI